MRLAVFSAKPYDRDSLAPALRAHEVTFFEERLTAHTVPLAVGYAGVCLFVNDEATAAVMEALAAGGCRLVALRCTGFNNVDLPRAAALGVKVVRVPAYSPYAVAEHTLGLMLSANRRIHRAYNRVREGNFSLEGLLGFDMHGSTVGLVGTGRVALILARTLAAMGCRLVGYDIAPSPAFVELGGTYVPLPTLYAESDIVSLHCPLSPGTFHLIGEEALAAMKPGVMLVNTGRGALIDTKAAIEGLKSGRIGRLVLDVYEQEAELFFEDRSESIIADDDFQRLIAFPNVLVTGHQAYFTATALRDIAERTAASLAEFEAGRPLTAEVSA